MSLIDETGSAVGEDSEDDMDWEEVAFPESNLPGGSVSLYPLGDEDPIAEQPVPGSGNIEITLQARPKDTKSSAPKKTGISHAERLLRIDVHKVHTVALLANASVRNKWINDDLLQARLLSMAPMSLQTSFTMIHKSTVPDSAKRGRLFEAAVTRLVEWWANDYFEVDAIGLRSRTFDQVAKAIQIHETQDPKGTGKHSQPALDMEDLLDNTDDLIRSPKSLQKHALQGSGSRDTSAQLFTALCRALGIPARLVCSLQAVPWKASVGKPKPKTKPKGKNAKGKGKGKGKAKKEDEDDDEMEEVDIPSNGAGPSTSTSTRVHSPFPGGGQRLDGTTPTAAGKEKIKESTPTIKLRGSQKLKGRTLADDFPPPPPQPTTTPPVFWTEVFSRADGRWIPVDPIRSLVNKRRIFDPTSISSQPSGPSSSTYNRLTYVVAFEEDGYARDVTARYAKEYGARVLKAQVADGRAGGKARKAWWDRVCGMVKRPYRLNRDDVEDEELQAEAVREGMPTSMTGFKDHPLYVLTRHLKHNETLHSPTELGKFRGEPVYPRSSVVSLKTAENWMRIGRKVKEGMQPMKWSKVRAVTVSKKREVEMAMAEERDRKGKQRERELGVERLGEDGLEIEIDDGMVSKTAGNKKETDEGIMQGLYAEFQTELYHPPPVVNGKIPKNDFGNIDLYVPSMLPVGAVHIPYKGTAKIARQLGFDYAEAVTGFEFRNRRATPIIVGIVIAMENEPALLEAYWEVEKAAEEKKQAKQHEQVLKRWIRLVQGLRIRQRLQKQYASEGRVQAEQPVGEDQDGQEEKAPFVEPGGYLTAVDDIVQPFSLPRYQHTNLDVPSTSMTLSLKLGSGHNNSPVVCHDIPSNDPPPMAIARNINDEEDMEEVMISAFQPNGDSRAPKTMRELAEDAARRQTPVVSPGSAAKEDAEEYQPSPPSPSHTAPNRKPVDTRRSRTGTPASAAKPRGGNRRASKRTRADSVCSMSGDDADAQNVRPSPAKRGKTVPTQVVKSDRVLRARAPKDPNKLQEEREHEEAYRRAIRG
ncbi:hypothetical protein JAAARDRAFT_190020 [Jaapia argillacea MUCL 33604]|uniref:Rad4 beta-hairpin domain-containing protein n=1 Tax=Jaapia argillacea MUCL 33604 TaxID=933084 RepID=A0A067QGT6_9AGAM|nr:hypothetical protein JAAARDRAFT_190020 [Jaapia argillacea MUCL 33604]